MTRVNKEQYVNHVHGNIRFFNCEMLTNHIKTLFYSSRYTSYTERIQSKYDNAFSHVSATCFDHTRSPSAWPQERKEKYIHRFVGTDISVYVIT